MTVSEFIEHLHSACSMEGVDPKETEINFISREYHKLNPTEIEIESDDEESRIDVLFD